MTRDMGDVDAVNERLNGLVTLLQAVGVGGDDVDRVTKGIGGKADLGLSGGARQLNDDQVEALIRKLQMAQSEAPQIIAALEAHAEARSLSGGASRSGGGSGSRRQQQQQQQPHEEEEDDDDDDDDEFDENANYPMVGHGCSDDISVVSDLTTPTVVSSIHVPDEEHYKDTLPPMIIGGGPGEAPPMMINPTKRKNLVSQVRTPAGPGGIAPPPRRNQHASRVGGAAAARRKNYQETMAKLHENPHAVGYAGPSGAPARKAPGRKSSGSGPTKKRAPKPTAQDVGNFSELASSRATSNSWESPSNWNAFENKSARPKSSKKMGRRSSTGPAPELPAKNTSVDADGFLFGGDGFDPFGSAAVGGKTSNPFKNSAANDIAFDASNPFPSSGSSDGFDAFGTGQPQFRPAASKPRKPRPEGLGGQPRPSQGVAASRPKGQASQGRPRRARRASLAM